MQQKSINIRRLFLAGGFPIALILLAGGCGSSAPPEGQGPAARPAEGAVVRVVCPENGPVALLERYSRAWSARTGGRVVVERSVPLGLPVHSPAPDICVIAPADLGRRVVAGHLTPVPETLTGRGGPYAWQDLLPLYRNHLLVWGGRAYALPVLGDAWLCFFRADLFRDAAHQAAFRAKYGRPLAAPATWDEVADLAEYFDRQPDRSCRGLPPLPIAEEDLDRQFYTVAASLVRRAVREDQKKPGPKVDLSSFHFDLTTGKPRIAGPGFVAALRLLQRLQNYRPAEPQRDPCEAFSRGEAVLCLAAPAWISRFQAAGSRVRDHFGICPVPGSRQVYLDSAEGPQIVAEANRVPYLGAAGWLAVVPHDAPHPDAGFELLADLTGPHTSQQIVLDPEWGGGAFRRQHLDNFAGWDAFGLDRPTTDALRKSVRQMAEHPKLINPVVRLRVPDQADYQRALAEVLRTALSQNTNAAAALAEAAKRWEAIQERKDAQVRRAEYRLSLGLSP
jgi:multiple sugar transport system substrate-binding protein